MPKKPVPFKRIPSENSGRACRNHGRSANANAPKPQLRGNMRRGRG